ncbi:MAG TPA: amidohydrolase family protein [Anaerolineales bacterium]|nr:amidohydrolase family protein [Anaerolineales bacterium]
MSYTLIRNGTLIDGTGKAPLSNAAVLIKENRIQAVGTAEGISLPNDSITEIDAGGGTILPGFIDTHVHLMLEGVNIARDIVTPFSMRFFNAVNYMKRTVEAGVTSVRDAGGADAGVKQAVESGVVLGPRMQISISVLTITGGHADGWMRSGMEFELFPSYPGYPESRVDGVDACRRKVREVLRAGADIIKICATGGVLSPTDHPEFTQFSPEELDVIVREAAYRRGVKVMAHAQGVEGIKNAVRAGIHSIEHGIFLDNEAIDLMLRHGTYLVPTLLAPLAVLEVGEKGGMPEYGVRKSREVVEIHSESISRAHKAGVKIAMGTDAGVMPHGTNLRELGLMVNIGMTPMQAIVATTKIAADCLGWQDQVGTIEAGKLADIVIAKTDPLIDIRSLENVDNIRLVMKDGKVVKDLKTNRSN